MSSSPLGRKRSFLEDFVPILFLGAISGTWFYQVSQTVQEPYLDEFFHIRQAKAYFENNNWTTWDPKITTPPGLYVLSYPWLWLLQAVSLFGNIIPGSINDHLRLFNVIVGLPAVLVTSRDILELIHAPNHHAQGIPAPTEPNLFTLNHAALNIALFPPLFFFCALYYTDVLSLAFVLLAYKAYLSSSSARLLLWGGLSLTLRQTNIFWVGVYTAGLKAVEYLKSRERSASGKILGQKRLPIRDLVVGDANVLDYFETAASLALALLDNLLSHPSTIPELLVALAAPVALLTSFALFVLVNGGVVLGDKTNHIASLHLPQMLYLWPYIVFFSLPLLLPTLLSLLLPPPSTPLPPALRFRGPALSRWWLATMTLLLPVTLAIIKYNTLIHPFTLADNRHYTFYVFRILLLRNPLVRYLAAPVYLLSGWVCIAALRPPLQLQAPPAPRGTTAAPKAGPVAPPSSSWLMVFLLTATLSLVTAPLVEPRYFIIPWVMWRLHVPMWVPAPNQTPQESGLASMLATGYDYRLAAETVWHLAINGATGWIFLNWGFEWPQEEGVVQRFMW